MGTGRSISCETSILTAIGMTLLSPRCPPGAVALIVAKDARMAQLRRIHLLGTSVNKTFPSHAPEVRSCHHGGGGKHVPPFSSRREENCRGRSGTRRGHPEHPRTGDGSAVGTKEPPGDTPLPCVWRRSCSGSCAQVVAGHQKRRDPRAGGYHGGHLSSGRREGILGRARPGEGHRDPA